MKKLAIITTHPIQYQIPLFKKLQKRNIKTNVFFASKHGLGSVTKDHEFKIRLKWDLGKDMLKGYQSYFPKKQKFNINDFRLSFNNIEKKLSENKYDALLLLGWNNLHYLKAFWFANKYNIKIIIRAETNLKSKISFSKKIIKYFLLKYFFSKIDFFLSIGKLNKQFYIFHKVNKKKIFKAPYSVDNKFFINKNKKSNFLKKINLNKKKIILFVGKFIPRKRPIDFIKLAKIFESENSLHFIMIGNGEMYNECQNYLSNLNIKNLDIKGFVNQKELIDYYNISELLIITSSYETWGLTINEAFNCGLPVICTKECGASHDLIKNNFTGLTFNSGDIKELQKKVKFFLKNQKIKLRIKKNMKNIINKFSLDETVNSIEKILNKISK